ncbi:hypothetical protein M0208_03830 [Sphingomonas sp. SUN019]|uniref:RNA polymerase sigma factor n=1 Tax=Sphingomonas sp. SUN019 TaxID=2937788 RepID=UPI002164453D|nr:sigma factor [Sphingomonas sp. SUN019]UVO49682.1 hypothetical protein M0208_03830 [Sphingomonas sp. SUN019]
MDGGLTAILLDSRTALLRFLSVRGVPRDEAEDLLQEMFLRLETHIIGPVAQPRAYLYRMADNLLLDIRHSAERRAIREREWALAQTGADLQKDERPSAEQTLLARERLALVSQALGLLPGTDCSNISNVPP